MRGRCIEWDEPWKRVLAKDAIPLAHWFEGGRLNVCHNAVDRHIAAGRAEQAAIIYESPVTGESATLTYAQLRDRVARFAGGLLDLGVQQGDRVVLYMPMIPETVVAMLACARIGAIHCVVFGGFAAQELATRIDDAKPRIVVAASCGIEPRGVVPYKPLLDKALAITSWQPEACIIFQRPQGPAQMVDERDRDWSELVKCSAPAACLPVEATDPLYILHTSGTTGKPKGVVRDSGGYAVALAWSMKNIYCINPGDVFWAASDVGWVVGHSYIVYGPLLVGATTVVYEGKPVGTPDAGAFWRVIEEHGVRSFFTAPTALRAIKREDPRGELLGGYDLSGLNAVYLAGERLDTDTYHWASRLLGVPVVDHWWQTETGWPIAANPLGLESLPAKPGSPGVPVPGYDLQVLDSSGQELNHPAEGLLALRLPLPPGTLSTLWQNEDRLISTYLSQYPGFFFTGDEGAIDEEGYAFVMGRVDDVINVAGHRLSTGRIEEVLAQHPDVAECAVVGVADEIKGQSPLALVVLNLHAMYDQVSLERQLTTMVREQVGRVAAFNRIVVVERLPKTRSGKILRGTIRKIASGADVQAPSSMDDPSVLEELKAILRDR